MTPEPSLRKVQEWFLELVTHPGDDEAALSQISQRFSAMPPDQVLRPGPRQSALERLHIYRYGYTARLVECLADDFGAVQFALGEDVFGELARKYVASYPSSGPNLNVYGQHFPAFVQAQSEAWAPFAAELATLEWALVEMVHAESGEGLSPEALQSVPPAQLANVRFVANPAVRLLSFAYPVNAYLRAFFREQQPRVPDREASAVVVARAGTTLRRIDASAPQALLLGRLLAGEPLLRALNDIDAEPAQIQAWFAEWTACHLFTALET